MDLAAAEGGQYLAVTAGPAHRVAVHALDHVALEAVLDLRLQFLRAESLIAHRRLAASGAGLQWLFFKAAVVAQHHVALLVIGQRQVAELAALHEAARRAMDVRREAAAVEQQHHLAAILERLTHRVVQRVAHRAETPLGRSLVAQINDDDIGQRAVEDALRQFEQRVLAALGVVEALQRRRGRAEDDRDVFQSGAHHGHVAGVVARRRFLLERALMLLVDDDQAELARGGEDAAAGADDDVDVAGRDAPPMAAALRVAEVAVQHSQLAAAALEALDRLRRQANLRHEDQCLLALLDDLLDRAQVNLRLAAAGDAVQQKGAEAARQECGFELLPDLLLVRVEDDRAVGRGLFRGVGELLDAPGHAPRDALGDERLNRAGATARQPAHLPHFDRAAEIAQLLEGDGLFGGKIGRR